MDATRGHPVKLDGITHRFGDFVAVKDVSLDIGGGELVALLGPSGCGKSTLLKIISGFIAQTSGLVLFDGKPVDHLPPSRRNVGIVFQNYALFPHMTVRQNIAYGLEAQHVARERIAPRVEEMLALVHMAQFGDRKPSQLSGGQQQRIALARCLAVDPKILLLDEPFGALDKNLRLDMQIEVKRLQREYGITTILVTHDQEEALSMADRVAVMNRGVIEQISAPTEIYDRPSTLFVNAFVGTTNVLLGEVMTIKAGVATLKVQDGTLLEAPAAGSIAAGQTVNISIRPEQLEIAMDAAVGRFPGQIKAVMPLGAQVLYEVALADGATMKIASPRKTDGKADIPLGATVHARPISDRSCRVFAKS